MKHFLLQRDLHKSDSTSLRLAPAFGDSDADCPEGPFLCIAENLTWLSDDACVSIRAIFISPMGNLLVVMSNRSSKTSLEALVKSWSLPVLDGMCENYTFQVYGQAFCMIDLMAKHGHLVFSEKSGFEDKLSSNLKSGKAYFFLSE